MGLLFDQADPTTALFLNEASASRAGDMAQALYPDRVRDTRVYPRSHRGERLGFAVQVRFKDNRQPAFITNSDFERLTGATQ